MKCRIISAPFSFLEYIGAFPSVNGSASGCSGEIGDCLKPKGQFHPQKRFCGGFPGVRSAYGAAQPHELLQ
jgi:hypothetical protein